MNKRVKLIKAMRTIRKIKGVGMCWNCGSIHGMKAGRMGYKHICTRCETVGLSTLESRTYDRLKAELVKLVRL